MSIQSFSCPRDVRFFGPISCGDYRNGFRKHICPDCGAEMIESAVFLYSADREWRKLWKMHLLYGGYFRMKRRP